ncbi:MAG TPA: DUF885 family protein, partial [Gemmatimonadaceae bacterium]|nr:DUF885 family protein [Gemmatimonadaceae bacterium]
MTTSLTAIIDGYLELRWQLDPVAATAAGAHEHDQRWPDRSQAAVRTLAAALRSYAGSLEEAEADSLQDEIDRTAALHAARHDIDQLERWRPFARDPGWHLRHLLDGLYVLLLTLPHDPVRRTEAIVARLRGAPEFLQTAVEALTAVAPVHIETARSMLPGAIDLVRQGIPDAPLDMSVLEPGVLDEAIGACVDGLLEFSEWLETASESADGDFALGLALYDNMLHTAHMLRDGADALARYGGQLRRDSEEELSALAGEIEPGTSWRELADRLDAEGAPEDTLGFLKAEIESAREFVERNDLLTLAVRPLVIEQTPPYLVPLVPLAAYVPAGA